MSAFDRAMVDWGRIHHFAPAEWPNQAHIDPALIYAVDALRDFIDAPILLHDTTGTGHDPAGMHPQGRAVDCHAEGIPLIEFWLAAERFSAFGGIGIYPEWAHPGLHLDTREAPHRARWWRRGDGLYYPVTAGTLAGLA